MDITEGKANYGRTLSQQEMAGILGTVREVVARSIRVLKESGIIGEKQNRIVIMDIKSLRTVAEGGLFQMTN